VPAGLAVQQSARDRDAADELAFARIHEGVALRNIMVQIANGWNWRTAWKLVD
jgi:hypothetical protein